MLPLVNCKIDTSEWEGGRRGDETKNVKITSPSGKTIVIKKSVLDGEISTHEVLLLSSIVKNNFGYKELTLIEMQELLTLSKRE